MEYSFMNKKQFLIIFLVSIGLGFGIGHYTSPKKIETVEHTVTVEKIVEQTHEEKNIHKIEKRTKDGTVTIETIIQSDIDKNVKKNELFTNDKEKTIESKTTSTTIDILGSVDVNHPLSITYGGHISENIIGPMRLGIFGFTDGKVGLSAGIQF